MSIKEWYNLNGQKGIGATDLVIAAPAIALFLGIMVIFMPECTLPVGFHDSLQTLVSWVNPWVSIIPTTAILTSIGIVMLFEMRFIMFKIILFIWHTAFGSG